MCEKENYHYKIDDLRTFEKEDITTKLVTSKF